MFCYSADAANLRADMSPYLFKLEAGEEAQKARDVYCEKLNDEFCAQLKKLNLAQKNIVFIFDEARALLESNFVVIRRALTHFPRSRDFCTPMTLMTDTAAKISNFSPSKDHDPSCRATQMPQGIFAPFYLLANVDLWVQPEDGPKTLKDMVNPHFYCRYGRPQWGASARQFKEGGFGIEKLMGLARAKVLGGRSFPVPYPERKQILGQSEEALAILGIRACIDLVPQCQLSQDLVAQHMRTLYSISASRDAVVTGYFSEPVLVLAAAQLTNSIHSGWEVLLEALVRSLRNGQVAAGFRGELVARLLLLMAWDRCVLRGLQGPASTHGLDVMVLGVFLNSVPLMEFLTSLLQLGIEVEADLSATFGRAWVRCTHFVKIDYVPDSPQLLELFKRGAAAVTKVNQAGTDIIIPMILCDNDTVEVTASMVSCIMGQIKNRRDGDSGYPATATNLQTPAATGIKIGPGLPYLSLYMSFGPKLGPNEIFIDTPTMRIHNLRSRSRVPKQPNVQKCLAVFSISSEAYPVLNANRIRLINHINQDWVDPFAVHRSEKERALVASMMPCQCAPTKGISGGAQGRCKGRVREATGESSGHRRQATASPTSAALARATRVPADIGGKRALRKAKGKAAPKKPRVGESQRFDVKGPFSSKSGDIERPQRGEPGKMGE